MSRFMTLDEFVQFAQEAQGRFPSGSRVLKNEMGNLSVMSPDWPVPNKLSWQLDGDDVPWDHFIGWLDLETGEIAQTGLDDD